MHLIMRNEEKIVHLAYGSSPKGFESTLPWESICQRARILGPARSWASLVLGRDLTGWNTSEWLKRHSYSVCLDCLAVLE